MDTESTLVIKLLESLADWNFKFSRLAMNFQDHPEVEKSSSNVEFCKYQTGTIIEGYVDLELKNDKSLCWWLEVRWNDLNWFVESSIILNDFEGQNVIYKFEEKFSTTFDSFLIQLSESIEQLIEFDAFNLPGVLN